MTTTELIERVCRDVETGKLDFDAAKKLILSATFKEHAFKEHIPVDSSQLIDYVKPVNRR